MRYQTFGRNVKYLTPLWTPVRPLRGFIRGEGISVAKRRDWKGLVGMNWSEDEVSQLRNLVAARLTASQIAAQMGCTRSAILAKMGRLGIESQSTSKHRNVNRFRKSKHNRLEATQPPHPWRTGASLASTPIEPPPQENDIARCGIFDLTSKTCRWPIGDPRQPDFGFCGDTPIPGVPYCRMHAARAFN